MAHNRTRPGGGSSVINLLSQRYKEAPDSVDAGKPRILYGQTGGAGKGPGSLVRQRSESTTYSFSQEEEVRQDGQTVYKTREEKSFSEKPQHWPGDSVAPAPKVSTKIITLTTSNTPGGGQGAQLTNSFGSPQKQSISISSVQPQRQQNYQYQQSTTTKSQYSAIPQPQQQQQQQQAVYQRQQQPTYGQQQPTYGQQQPTFGQQQTTYSQQQATYSQQKQQPTYGQQQQPQQLQPSYGQQQQAQQLQPSYGQQQQQQQPRHGKQQQQTTYSQTQKTTTYQQQQTQQQRGYGAQQPTYQPQPQQPTYQPQPQQPTYQPQPQQPSYQPQPQQVQQQKQVQQQVSYQQQPQQRSAYAPQQPQQSLQQKQRSGYPQQQSQQQQQHQQTVTTVRSTSGGVQAPGQQPATRTTVTATTRTSTSGTRYPWEDEPEEGVHENVPEQRPDVVRESQPKDWSSELPSAGLARNVKEKFITGNLENRPAAFRREITPPGMERGGGGVFENQPVYNPDVVHYGEEVQREALPERGTARNVAQRFKEIGNEGPRPGSIPDKREITPDRTTRGEYVSEPRGYVEKYEGRPESGVFESQPVYLPGVIKADEYEDDRLQECGLARNIAAHFRQVGNLRPPPSPSGLKEFTPPREEGSALQGYGVYENTPEYDPRVVHHEDHQHDVLPQRGAAHSIATRFRKMSAGDTNASAGPRGKKEFTPPRDGGGVYENEPLQFIPDYNQRPESGVLENQPEVRYDVVRADEPPPYEKELPDRGAARSLVYSWRQKESGSTPTPTGSGKPKEFTPPREEPRVLQYRAAAAPHTPRSAGGDYGDYFSYGPGDGSVHPNDLPGQYHPLAEATEFESQPVLLQGVFREADTDWMEGMPRSETTSKMLARFRHIQQQAATTDFTPPPSSRPPLPAQVGRSKSMRVAVQLEKCGACQKTVYAMEKIEIEKNAYHKSCFRCSHCHCVLTPKTFAINKNVMFCTNHYKQLFATKGNYDEGFGHDQHKNRWKHGDQSRDSSPLPSSDTSATSIAASLQQ